LQHKKTPAAVIITCVSVRNVSYIAQDKTFSLYVAAVAVPPRLRAGDRAQEGDGLSRLLIARKIRISSELVKDFFSKAKITFQSSP
jgi:hypothetical protein